VGGGDAHASCASPLGTPLATALRKLDIDLQKMFIYSHEGKKFQDCQKRHYYLKPKAMTS
jgi:hypothetical protein